MDNVNESSWPVLLAAAAPLVLAQTCVRYAVFGAPKPEPNVAQSDSDWEFQALPAPTCHKPVKGWPLLGKDAVAPSLKQASVRLVAFSVSGKASKSSRLMSPVSPGTSRYPPLS